MKKIAQALIDHLRDGKTTPESDELMKTITAKLSEANLRSPFTFKKIVLKAKHNRDA